MESTPQSENNLNQNDIILTETQNPAPNIEDNKYSIKIMKEKAISLAKEYENDNSKVELIKNAFQLDNTNSYINSLYIQSLKGKNDFPEIFLNFNYSLDENEMKKINPNSNSISEKEKFTQYISKLENCNTLDDIFIFSSTQTKITNPFDREKYFPNKPIDLTNDHQFHYYMNFYLSEPSLFLNNQYFKSMIAIIKVLYEKNERTLLYGFLHNLSNNKKKSNLILCIYYLLSIYNNENIKLFNEVYSITEKMLSSEILELLVKQTNNFNKYFETVKPIFIECLNNFLKSKLIHSVYDTIIKKEKIAPLNEETISYFLEHISFKPLFDHKDSFTIYPETLEIIVNTSFTFKDLLPLEAKNYYLIKLKKLFFSVISSLEQFLTYYKYYIHLNKNHIRILEKKFENCKITNIINEGNMNLKQVNYIFNSNNWNKDITNFNLEIDKLKKNKTEVYLGDYFEKFCEAEDIDDNQIKELIGEYKTGIPEDNIKKKDKNKKGKEKIESKKEKKEKKKEKTKEETKK